MRKDKCGIYEILCRATGHRYVGSSRRIYARWWVHRSRLRTNKSSCRKLQRAWNRHGAAAFVFCVIEECSIDQLLVREQFYIDTLKPELNVLKEVKAIPPEAIAAYKSWQKSRVLNTHCKHGHPFDETNTLYNTRGARVCRRCTSDQRKAKRQNDPEHKEKLNVKTAEWRLANPEKVRITKKIWDKKNAAEVRAYGAAYQKAHPEKKAAQDRRYRASHADTIKLRIKKWCDDNRDRLNVKKNENRRKREANETPEQRERRLRLKRESANRAYRRKKAVIQCLATTI